jgi:hypothetical protein
VNGNLIGETALAEFRSHWTGTRFLDLLNTCGGRMAVTLPVGTGKSTAIDQIMADALATDRHDLVVVLSPTRELLNERAWIHHPPAGINIINIRPRPASRCGHLDQEWRVFERAGMAMLGRETLCSRCPQRDGCYWPDQYGSALRGAHAVFATHAHLARAPHFLRQIARAVGAHRPLTLIDEDAAAVASASRHIDADTLARFAEVVAALAVRSSGATLGRWAYLTGLLRVAGTGDLRSPDWDWPTLPPQTLLELQRLGWARYGPDFRFLGYDAESFAASPPESRERTRNGAIRFAAPPWIGSEVILFSGTSRPEFLTFRLGKDFPAPFAGLLVRHPDTQWYNIATRLATRQFFTGNADQILDFFAALVDMRLRAGKRILLIAKKCFVPFCANAMTNRLRALGHKTAAVLTGNWDEFDLTQPGTVALIHFGVIGVNRFEHFDCAFCLTGFFTNERVLDAVLHDLVASDGMIPVKIRTEGRPRRRRAGVLRQTDRDYDVDQLAQLALDRQETDIVLQAVGRVRPYTRPREVITLLCASHPHFAYDSEFDSLADARKFFAVSSRRRAAATVTAARVRDARAAGKTQAQAAQDLNLGIATVKRYWNDNLRSV